MLRTLSLTRGLLLLLLAAGAASLHSQPAPVLSVQAAAAAKVYGTPDPAFAYSYSGFTGGDGPSALGGQPALAAVQKVMNLWAYTESLDSPAYQPLDAQSDGGSRQINGILLGHFFSPSGNFYATLTSPLSALSRSPVYPGVQYLLSFYAFSTSPASGFYWHRFLATPSSAGWGPDGVGSTPARLAFSCTGMAGGLLDCGDDPAVPLGSGAGSGQIFWLFSGTNLPAGMDPNGNPSQLAVPFDLYAGGFQMEPVTTEKRGIVAMGDSKTQYNCDSFNVPGCSSWTEFAAAALHVPFFNRGVGGQTCDQILARWQTDASPILRANARYVTIYCGTNDMVVHTADQIIAYLNSMAQLAEADGAQPVVVTIGPFEYALEHDDAENIRQTVNAYIRASFPLVLDFDQVDRDPANPRQQNPAHYGDGTHLNLAGRQAEGAYVAASVRGNGGGYPSIWDFEEPMPYQPVPGENPSNGMDFSPDAQREVGRYVIVPSAGSLSSAKYAFAYRTALLTVTPAALIAAANSQTIHYGDPRPPAGGTLSGALAADGITAAWSAAPGTDAGAYPVTATLADPNHRLSNYAVTLSPGTLTILPAVTATTLSLSTAELNLPAALALTARMRSGAGNPPGSVIFYQQTGGAAQATMLGQAAADGSGNATLTLASLAPGSSVIYAAYPGSRDFAPSTSLPLALQVFAGAPSFTVHAAAASLQLSGLTASLGLTLVPANGYDGEVALSCSSSSPAVTCTPSPAELAGNLAGTPVTGSLEVSRSSGRAELPLGGWLTGCLGLAAATRRRRRVAMAALAVAALLVPGCGGGTRAPVTLTLHAQGSATGRGTAPAAASQTVTITVTE